MPDLLPDAALDTLLREALAPREEVAATPAEGGDGLDEGLDDGLLAAWRAGRLEADESAAVDARLAADPEARAVAWAQAAWPVDELQVQRALGQIPTAQGPAAQGSAAQGPAAQVPARRAPARRTFALALAAGLLVAGGWWWQRGAPAPAPDYLAGSLAGGIQATRGPTAPEDPPAAPIPVYPDAVLSLPLRPRVAQDAAPLARAYLSPDDGPKRRLRALETASHPAAKGALTVRVTLPGLPPGPVLLWVVLGPTPLDGQPLGEARATSGLSWHRRALVVVPAEDEVPR